MELKNKVNELEKKVEKIEKLLEPNININKLVLKNKSVIMNENEFEMIHLAIKSRLNKEVKELKKLYQATIDGDGGVNFHSRCDNIPNTLVLIKSAGNRRFIGSFQQNGNLLLVVIIGMIKMLFCFLLINKKFILIKIKEMQFIII